VEADPRSAAGHEIFGTLLYGKGDLPGAKRELSDAVQLQPENWRAQAELGIVLARPGDRADALQHLTAAAQGPDPDARAAAEQALRALIGKYRRKLPEPGEWSTGRQSKPLRSPWRHMKKREP
jgi:tetratricopeptide (TPR) repeat protein